MEDRKTSGRITEAGLDLLSEIDVIHKDFENDIVGNLSASEISTLNTLLKKIRNK